MATDSLTRIPPAENLKGNFVGSLVFHGALFAILLGYGYIFHTSGNSWGDNSAPSSTIQATMVNSIPLPPRQPTNADNVLTSETPSPAPPVAKEKVAPPRPTPKPSTSPTSLPNPSRSLLGPSKPRRTRSQ